MKASSAIKRPFVYVNIAMTADGKIAFDDGRFVPFGSEHDRQLLLKLRTKADAVMSGANTVSPYPVNLGPGPKRFREERLRRGLSEYNLRVVVSGQARLSPKAEIFRHHFSPVVVLTTESAPASRRLALQRAGAKVEVCGLRQVDFKIALELLYRRWHVRSLLCEGGGVVNDALFRAGLVDELHLTICPWIFGGRNAPTLADGLGQVHLNDATNLHLSSFKKIGRDLFLIYRTIKTTRRVR